jgi:Ca2+-binding EF-hand superfamily protein
LFQRLDKNGDGVLAAEEIPEEQRRFFERMLRTGDANSDGKISREEFEAASRDQTRPAPMGPGGRPGW